MDRCLHTNKSQSISERRKEWQASQGARLIPEQDAPITANTLLVRLLGLLLLTQESADVDKQTYSLAIEYAEKNLPLDTDAGNCGMWRYWRRKLQPS